jgi:hypothetical protein
MDKQTVSSVMRQLGKRSAAKLTKKERIERARAAGKASGKARRAKGKEAKQ